MSECLSSGYTGAKVNMIKTAINAERAINVKVDGHPRLLKYTLNYFQHYQQTQFLALAYPVIKKFPAGWE